MIFVKTSLVRPIPGIFAASHSVAVLLRGNNGSTTAVLLLRAVVVSALPSILVSRPFPRIFAARFLPPAVVAKYLTERVGHRSPEGVSRR